MPALSRWFVRTALVYLGLGFGLGALLLVNKALGLDGRLWALLPLHVEWLLLGWTLQLAFGVAFWILPREGGVRRREGIGWLGYGLLNVGLVLSAVGRLAGLAAGRPAPAWLLPLAAAVLVAGVVAFVGHVWPRVVPLVRPDTARKGGRG